MRVKIYDVDRDGNETPRGECWLNEAIERDDPEYEIACAELRRPGRYWGGGGAAPLFFLAAAK